MDDDPERRALGRVLGWAAVAGGLLGAYALAVYAPAGAGKSASIALALAAAGAGVAMIIETTR